MQAFLLYKAGDQTRRVDCKEVMIIGREEGNDINLPSELWQGREQTISVAGKTQPLDVWGISFEEATALLHAEAAKNTVGKHSAE